MKNTELKKLYLLRSKALMLSLVSSACILCGCAKKVDCDIEEYHSHVYVNDEGYKRDIVSEKEKVSGYYRTDEYDIVENAVLANSINKNKLLKIDDNLDIITKNQNNNVDFIEYRYRYTTLIPIFYHIGKVTHVSFVPAIHHSWTTNKDDSRLTGETRICHYVYQACKPVLTDKGKYKLVYSDYVDDLTTIKDEYPFIEQKYYKVISLENNEEADYEDGQDYEDSNYDPEKDDMLNNTQNDNETLKLTQN